MALVYDKELVMFPHIEYIGMRWPKKAWVNRLWCEYVAMKKISRWLSPVSLWLSLHDTTPNVVAERQAVYCHNPFPFYRWNAREWFFTPKIVLFALFSKFVYRVNIHRNDYVVVQQQWIKDAFTRMFGLEESSVIVAPPASPQVEMSLDPVRGNGPYAFLYASSPNSHKNFECICKAAEMLEKEPGVKKFDVYITVKGDENAYARWLYKNWGKKVSSLHFTGFLDKASLYRYYANCNCLVFPSKTETWGLPVSEFAAFGKPMLLADLPYAHETAGGSGNVSFFDPENPRGLAMRMKQLIAGNASILKPVPKPVIVPPVAGSWKELFSELMGQGL